MRKITKDAVNAFLKFKEFHRDNTEVEVWDLDDGSFSWLYLHGNCIAELRENRGTLSTLRICDGGYFQGVTHTTKERLNGLPGVNVWHAKHVLYLNGVPWSGDWVTVNHDGTWY